MSKEEKKAIWYCSEILDANENDIEQWKIVENLIDRLQKELEKANKQLDLDYVDNNFISKDKIRELKQKLLEEGNNLTEEQRQTETEFRQGKLKAYEDLLKEN